MDLKLLLLSSISSKKTARYTKRIYRGRYCYIISFEVKGKYLKVKRIKRTLAKMPLRQRLHRRLRLLRKLMRCYRRRRKTKSNDDITAQEESSVSQFKESPTQTKFQTRIPCRCIDSESRGGISRRSYTISEQQVPSLPSFLHKPWRGRHASIQTERRAPPVHSETQTLVIVQRGVGTQTDLNLDSHSVQTEWRTIARSNQTYWSVQSIATQVIVEYCSSQTQTELMKSFEEHVEERDAVILMLNEIGEMIINQNHLLHNNTVLLGQITEMTMLTKLAATRPISMKNVKKITRLRRARQMTRNRKKIRYIFLTKHHHLVDTRNRSVQAVVIMLDQSTETNEDGKKKGGRMFSKKVFK